MTETLTSWTLSVEEMQAVAALAGAVTVPAELRLPRTPAAGSAQLRDSGLADSYGVLPELETVLRVLATADREYSVLMMDAPGNVVRPKRLLVAVAGGQAAWAEVGADGQVRIGELPGSGPDSVAAAIWRALGEWPAADVIAWRGALEDLGARLADCRNQADLAAALLASGCTQDQAQTLAAALAAPRRAEIVARVRVDGITQTSIGAVAVFDGAAGRFVAVPDISNDRIAWTTLSGGTRRRLEQALEQLVATASDSEVA